MTAVEILAEGEAMAATRGVSQWEGLMLVLVERFRHIELPDELMPVLETAARRWETGTADDDDLFEAKDRTCSYLESIPGSNALIGTNVRHARALLCVLEPDGDVSIRGDTAEWYALMTGEDEW
jgi:hypothetical protein